MTAPHSRFGQRLKHEAFKSSSGLTRGSITRVKRYEMGGTVKPCNDSAQRGLMSGLGQRDTKTTMAYSGSENWVAVMERSSNVT